jgi:hypothetical protein
MIYSYIMESRIGDSKQDMDAVVTRRSNIDALILFVYAAMDGVGFSSRF